jgi:hypothetical protein
MRFLCLYHIDAKTAKQPPSPERYQKMSAFVEESFKNGTLISTGGIGGGSAGTRVSNEGGEFRVVDGPYAEAKELVGGYALMEFPSKEVAIEYTKKFLTVAGGGASEIFQLDN